MALATRETDPVAAASAPVLAVGSLVACGMGSGPSVELTRTAWEHGFRGFDLERLGRDLASLGRAGEGPPSEEVGRVMELLRDDAGLDRVFQHLDGLLSTPDSGVPGVLPGEPPGRALGPDGTPVDPGHTGSRSGAVPTPPGGSPPPPDGTPPPDGGTPSTPPPRH
jgi:hypothetical protein